MTSRCSAGAPRLRSVRRPTTRWGSARARHFRDSRRNPRVRGLHLDFHREGRARALAPLRRTTRSRASRFSSAARAVYRDAAAARDEADDGIGRRGLAAFRRHGEEPVDADDQDAAAALRRRGLSRGQPVAALLQVRHPPRADRARRSRSAAGAGRSRRARPPPGNHRPSSNPSWAASLSRLSAVMPCRCSSFSTTARPCATASRDSGG